MRHRIVPRLLREPTVWFFAFAAILLATWQRIAGDHSTITVTREDVAELGRTFAEQWGREPTEAEREALINDFVQQEILVREALRLGLDSGDPIVRRRLLQKMTFLLEANAAADPPDEASLQRYFEENAARYQEPERVSFQHAYWQADTIERGSAANGQLAPPPEVLRMRERLVNGADPASVSRPFLRGLDWKDRSVEEVERTFGAAFTQALRNLPVGSWSEPIQSLFGWHVVRVRAWHPARIPDFSAIRARVEQDWLEEARARAREDGLQRLRRKYRVIVSP
jgi:hypothetical protein